MRRRDLHPILSAAASGRLPEWAVAGADRRGHLERVAGLLGRWAAELGLVEVDRARWAAAGWLHDSLRDADPDQLAGLAGDYPRGLRHGPAVAARLEAAGVDDAELLEAVRHHSLGRRGMGRLGCFLYLADYLEPGRCFDPLERAELNSRLPAGYQEVLRRVCTRRITYLLDNRVPLHPDSVDFYNELVGTR